MSELKQTSSERDWPEDFKLENGNYYNICTTCRQEFMGYKRRFTCKVCAGQGAPSTPREAARHNVKALTARTTELVGEVIAKGMLGVLEECIEMQLTMNELKDRAEKAEAELAELRRTQPEATAPATIPKVEIELPAGDPRKVKIHLDTITDGVRWLCCTIESPAAQDLSAAILAAVDRFLCWELPRDFNPDGGININTYGHQFDRIGYWPTGTNLFTAKQAKAMFEHCFASSANALSEADRVDAIADAARSVLREALDAARVHPCDSNNDNARAKQLSPLMQRLYRVILQSQKGDSRG